MSSKIWHTNYPFYYKITEYVDLTCQTIKFKFGFSKLVLQFLVLGRENISNVVAFMQTLTFMMMFHEE